MMRARVLAGVFFVVTVLIMVLVFGVGELGTWAAPLVALAGVSAALSLVSGCLAGLLSLRYQRR